MSPFLAMIVPMGGTPVYPDQGLPSPPLGTWGGAGQPFPTPPIAPPPYPSQGPGFPTHPIYMPPGGGQPPVIWPSPGRPSHPIAPGGPPPGYWGGGGVPMPTPPIYIPIVPPAGSGGEPSHPIYIPVYPSHPIEIPPGSSPDEIYEKVKSAVDFLTGNLPTNPDPAPTPV